MEQMGNRSLTEEEEKFLCSLSRGDLIWAKIKYGDRYVARFGPYLVTKSSSGCLKFKDLDSGYNNEPAECSTFLGWLLEKIADQHRFLEKV